MHKSDITLKYLLFTDLYCSVRFVELVMIDMILKPLERNNGKENI